MKKKECILGIDVGTTNCKTILFNKTGIPIAKSIYNFNNIYDRLGPGWVEQDSMEWIKSIVVTIKEVVCICNNNVEIVGIALSTQRPTIVPVDKDFIPLRYAITWQTNATSKQVNQIKKMMGNNSVYKKTGLTISPVWSAPMIKYISEEEPEVHKKTYKYIQVQTFLLHWLGVNDFIIDISNASTTMLMDLKKNSWDEELCQIVGISAYKLPNILPSAMKVGTISKNASELTGLKIGTPIILGGADSQCSALGAGVTKPGIINIMLGTAEVAESYSKDFIIDSNQRILYHSHTILDAYVVEGTILAAGDAYRWAKNLLYGENSSYASIDNDISEVPIGSKGVIFLPHQAGAATPYWNDSASGVFFGIKLGTDKSCVARAVAEGVIMEIAKFIHIIEETGINVTEIRLTGGTSFQGSPWNRMQCDIYGKPVTLIKVSDTGALGAAILAGVGVGLFSSQIDAAEKMVKKINTIKPIQENHIKYMKLIEKQNDIYQALHSHGIYKNDN